MGIRNHSRRPAEQMPAGLLTRLAAIPCGRRAKWLVLVFWLVVVAAVSPVAGKLTDVEENDAAAWLPGSAESLQVNELQSDFPGGETLTAVIVYHRDGGLTAEDQAKIEADRQALTAQFPDAPAGPPIPSEDGQAVIVAMPFPAGTKELDERAFEAVPDVRDLVGGGAAGLDVKVTGPAGFSYDFANVFSGIDSTLLIATASVVAILLLITYRSPFLWLVPLLVVAFANQTATAAVYALAKNVGLTVNGMSSGILPVLVFGAGTDYALLLIARYREELR